MRTRRGVSLVEARMLTENFLAIMLFMGGKLTPMMVPSELK